MRTDPLTRNESSVYDLAGNLTQFTDRKGQVSEFTYDPLNRRTFAGFGKTGTTYQSTIGYTYDAGNRLTQVTDSGTGILTRTYDGFDRLLSETSAVGTITYTYDADGRRSSATVTGQLPVTYQYDAAERLVSITQGTSVVAFTYDDANRRTALTFPNGIVASYEYDGASQLTRIAYQGPSGILGDLIYTYDDRGNRTQIGGSWARVTLPTAVASAVHDAANQLTQWAGQTHTYDANGNLTNDGVNVYTWNARNQLSGITGGSVAAFTYDGVGRRRSKTIGGTSTSFLYDNADIVQELSGGTPTAQLLNGLSIDERFVRTDATGSFAFLTDALGSTMTLADASAAVTTQYTFEPFGAASSTGTASTNTFQFTGRESDAQGLLYYRARYNRVATGRFLSEDPISRNTFGEDGWSTYSYVSNSPTNYVDPYGLFRVAPGVPQPSAELAAILSCIEARTGTQVYVTSTSRASRIHPRTSPHGRGVAVDFQFQHNARTADEMLCAAYACGAGFGLDEYRHPSPNSTGGHMHFQIPQGSRGGWGNMPTRQCNCNE